jgi:hypothetical protein
VSTDPLEDAFQTRWLACKPLVLPYDPSSGLILRGLFQGRLAGVVAAEYRAGHARNGRSTTVDGISLRPWWRLWRWTPALLLQVWPPT